MPNQTNLLLKEKTTKQNRVWVRISAACNNKCVFCLDSEAQDGRFIEDWIIKKQIQEGYKDGYENRVIISWWEASINPKFADYIKYAKEVGYDRVQTVTNWNMFANEAFCKKVFEAWLEEVTFSFHGHTPSLHDYLVATPWAFRKSLKWLIYIIKNYPQIIINIDIVVNKLNVHYLPDIVKFFMKLWIYEYDILQIIPFGRWFSENKDTLFYDVNKNISYLHDTWKLSKIPWMYMWTNRFPAESFEWYEDLIQDPRKMKSEVMGEAVDVFQKFIMSRWSKKPHCYGEACSVCFQQQYCHDFIKNIGKKNLEQEEQKLIIHWSDDIDFLKNFSGRYIIFRGKEFPSEVYESFWSDWQSFQNFIHSIKKIGEQKILNIPKCLWGDGIYEKHEDMSEEYTLENYTKNYILNLYRKKSLRCNQCKHNNNCEGVHINFIRAYGFKILQPIL